MSASDPLESVQLLYDWLREASPTLALRCSNTEAQPCVRLFIRIRPVENAFEITLKFFASDEHELPVTVLPFEHRKTIAELMVPKKGVPMSFAVHGEMRPGSAIIVMEQCTLDECIRLR